MERLSSSMFCYKHRPSFMSRCTCLWLTDLSTRHTPCACLLFNWHCSRQRLCTMRAETIFRHDWVKQDGRSGLQSFFPPPAVEACWAGCNKDTAISVHDSAVSVHLYTVFLRRIFSVAHVVSSLSLKWPLWAVESAVTVWKNTNGLWEKVGFWCLLVKWIWWKHWQYYKRTQLDDTQCSYDTRIDERDSNRRTAGLFDPRLSELVDVTVHPVHQGCQTHGSHTT